MHVKKRDGTEQEFDREKIISTCTRMGASTEIAEKIAENIERKVKEGVSTKRVINLIFQYMRKYNPRFRYMNDLRDAVCVIRPKPDFEVFVGELLEAHGFKIKMNQMVMGKCVEHEIDAVAERTVKDSTGQKRKEIYYVEVKHHYKAHTYTGLGVFLQARATFDDLMEGYERGTHKIPFTHALVVSNTKLSDHAARYCDCAGIRGLAWATPRDRGLERMIEEKHLYPITILKGLHVNDVKRLGDAGVVTLKQVMEIDERELSRISKLSKKKIREVREMCKQVLMNTDRWPKDDGSSRRRPAKRKKARRRR